MMSHKPWMFMSLIAALSGLVHSAAAETASFFQSESLDENGDGAVTTEEFEAHMLERWAEDDLNDDGKVTQTEMKTKLEQRRVQRFRHADGNKDGVIERSEARHLPEEMFARLDADRSGALSQAEFDSVSTSSLGRANEEIMLGPADTAGQLRGDEDRDGVITRAEALTLAQEVSTLLDINGDGVLNREELGQSTPPSARSKGRRGAQTTASSSVLDP